MLDYMSLGTIRRTRFIIIIIIKRNLINNGNQWRV